MKKFKNLAFLAPLFLLLGFGYSHQPTVMKFKSSKFQTKETYYGKYDSATVAQTSFKFNFGAKSITKKVKEKLLEFQIDSIKESVIVYYKVAEPKVRPRGNFIYCHVLSKTKTADSLKKYVVSYQYLGKKITEVKVFDFSKKNVTLYLR